MSINNQSHNQVTTGAGQSISFIDSIKSRRIPRQVVSLLLYSAAFVIIIAAVAVFYIFSSSGADAAPAITSSSNESSDDVSVDGVVATVVAADVADSANLSVATNVANLSVSLMTRESLAKSTISDSVAKEQALQPTSRRVTAIHYKVKSGDTVKSLAKHFDLKESTIKWANDLTSNDLSEGKKLVIPPVDGVIYKVKKGDKLNKLAKKYKASKDRIIAFNNLELSGLEKGKKIIIPAGVLPEVDRPGYTSPQVIVRTAEPVYSYRAGSVGNRYSYGYCTFYVYNRRSSMGKPVGSFWGDAKYWAGAARSQGYRVDNEPEAGAVFQTTRGYYGHVGIIESVNHENGTVTYTDMNGGGWGTWNVIRKPTTIPISQAKAQWTFIH